jgi:hypothetical protein
MRHIVFQRDTFVHLLAAGLALLYAWFISQSAYVTTGLQFVAPLVIIMVVHLSWLAVSRGLSVGFSNLVYWRSAQSSVGMALVILFASVVAPKPAQAAGGDIIQTVLMVVFCVAIIAIVAGVIALVVYAFFKLILGAAKVLGGKNNQGPDSRLFDVGTLAATGLFLGLCSMEGVPNSYAFPAANQSKASYFVQATPVHVWQTMDLATSPDFPLPNILGVFPQPVDVVTDEGTALGDMRVVEFQGREGTGYLTLRVVERTEARAVFKVVSDTSPYANWVAHQRLVYHVQPEADGARLTVILEYDRLLAPAWFFTPTTKGAAYLAMDVLARDVKMRAES